MNISVERFKLKILVFLTYIIVWLLQKDTDEVKKPTIDAFKRRRNTIFFKENIV
jgi:hypothetical protein